MTYTGLSQDKARARAARAYRLDRKTVAEAHRRLLERKHRKNQLDLYGDRRYKSG